jgi:hypothetical protein
VQAGNLVRGGREQLFDLHGVSGAFVAIIAVPPGRSTRLTSATARRRSGTWYSMCRHSTTSTLWSPNGHPGLGGQRDLPIDPGRRQAATAGVKR